MGCCSVNGKIFGTNTSRATSRRAKRLGVGETGWINLTLKKPYFTIKQHGETSEELLAMDKSRLL